MKKKGLLNEFKDFISRGNVMDMAVGVIIGAAFTAIVNSLVSDILMPIIGGLLSGIDFTQRVATIGSATITYGNFIQSIINFLLIAWVVFMLVRTLNKMKKKEEEAPAPAPAPAEPSEEILLLREIRDSLRDRS